jgi:small subunit ribosomal protein S20|tara:strand:+ start:1330 stop:1611 length:282 start_codon:yes stop_codon:yes gene_type:complete
MANTKSSEKRIKINERNRLENRTYKGNIKSTIKIYLDALKIYEKSNAIEDRQKIEELLKTAYSQIDKATKKNIFHKNKAARKKSQLAGYLKTI